MLKKMIIGLFLLMLPWQAALAVEINFSDASVADVSQALAKEAGIDLIMSSDQGAAKRTSVHLKDATAEEALQSILKANGYSFEKKGNVMTVSTLPQDLSQTAYKPASRVYRLKYASADKITALLAKVMPSVTCSCGLRANSLVVRGKESDLDEAETLIGDLDYPVPQILIESKVVEVSESDSIRFGIDHNSGTFKFINGKNEDVMSTLNLLLGSGKANLVASPKIATLDNSEAVINIGNRIPYAVPVCSSSTATQWTVDYIDAGVKLKIVPQLGNENSITTLLQPEVSSVSEWRSTAAGEFPVISTRNASATVRVKNGETIVVGGLISDTDRVSLTRVPILGQIPLLNLLFQNRTVEKEKTEILFLITPYVI
ncbi:MAG TPA: secretin N-terminal domain-containing protein [Candidatus Omnitrophota bacterium]|nr:secretin N-terminal domain-containing protein [Candidatus Omnitrophota bacterium]